MLLLEYSNSFNFLYSQIEENFRMDLEKELIYAPEEEDGPST